MYIYIYIYYIYINILELYIYISAAAVRRKSTFKFGTCNGKAKAKFRNIAKAAFLIKT